MKLWCAVLLLVAAATVPALAQEEDRPAGSEFILGPRVGANYVFTSVADSSAQLSQYYIVGDYFPLTSLFGIISEQRILLGQTRSHFAFQELLLVSGLEQGVSIPTAGLLIGYRDASGFEIGFGPRVTMTGIGVIVAGGWTFRYKGVFVPVDVSFVLPSQSQPASLALTTGFNFVLFGSRRSATGDK